ncbi:hypothetical protein HHL16_06700 [Pseudoflavitalea sp. G-6-1-2]|uniref:helix-hairpin-helix domain-containing protein n=1 Tax=Pseudoflavitalea sp. G-6-1-2 TaxID=2728841 RepID=UPI00146D8A12|nr:helix-hairpin-helix domain-containing protein [Pseudoflavitalea sp. G-6-1-2]NML20555.1 hypothetical protein [Pseudoflavitalea sp. G-6-1-2]
MKESWKDYLVFSKKERTGIYLLLVILGIVCVLPRFFCAPELTVDADAAKKIQEELLALQHQKNQSKYRGEIKRDGNGPEQEDENDRGDKMPQQPDAGELATASTDQSNGAEVNNPVSLFNFDPNTLAFSGWRQLGIPEKIVRTIFNYLSKGGRFRKPEDITKIYGMHANDAQRLMPYIRINSSGEKQLADRRSFYQQRSGNGSYPTSGSSLFSETFNRETNQQGSGLHYQRTDQSRFSSAVNYPRRKQYIVTDINAADTADWARLPGIGSRLAFRIVQFREKLGGFHSIDQVAETWALPDSTFQKIKPWLRSSTIQLRKIRINEADQETLRQHPYLRWELARAIVDFRKQHGPFKSIGDLTKIILLPPLLITKIAPYIEFNIP